MIVASHAPTKAAVATRRAPRKAAAPATICALEVAPPRARTIYDRRAPQKPRKR